MVEHSNRKLSALVSSNFADDRNELRAEKFVALQVWRELGALETQFLVALIDTVDVHSLQTRRAVDRNAQAIQIAGEDLATEREKSAILMSPINAERSPLWN